MVEFREDGTIQGPPKVGRIYKMSNDGVLRYATSTCELESDWPLYIETYKEFRGFASVFLDLDALDAELQRLRGVGFLPAEVENEKVMHLRSVFMKARDVAEKAAHAYFAACPVGRERELASKVYENILNATRVAR